MSRPVASVVARPHLASSEESFLDAFRVAKTALRGILAETVGPLGLRGCQFWVLSYIGEEGPVSGGRLADELGVTPPSVTSAVQDLVDAGLVARERSEADRRVVMLSATPRGRKVLGEIWTRLGVRITERTRGLPSEDFAAAARVLRAVGTRGVLAPNPALGGVPA